MVMKSLKPWRTFEDAVREIVSQHRDFFGLQSVEPISGKVHGESGYVWNIEVIGYAAKDLKMVLFEVRRKSTRNIEPSEAGELAYRIRDIGATKGYFVTPLDRKLSSGAKKIADFNEIGHIQVSVDSTPENHLMKCVNRVFAAFSDGFDLDDAANIELADKDGNVLLEDDTRHV
jgi:hypothetical protein